MADFITHKGGFLMNNQVNVFEEAKGKWKDVITDLTSIKQAQLANKHQPCPLCGGDDRYRFDDKDGQGTYFCNVCGPGTGYTLIKKHNRWDDKEAIYQIKKHLGLDNELNIISPVPKNVQWDRHTLINRDKFYNFNHCYEWLDEEANLIGYVARFDLPEGKKIVWQILYAHSKDGRGWHQTTHGKNKPLFGLETLKKSNQVLVVEGEKTQSAAAKILDDWGVVTVQGGAKSVKKSNLKPLIDKEIFIYPDNDEAGREYALEILKAHPKAKIIKVPSGKPKGWDLADGINEGMTKGEIVSYIMKNIEETNLKNIEIDPIATLKEKVRPLGFNRNEFYYCPTEHKQLIVLGPSQHTSRHLISMADIQHWLDCFPGKQASCDWVAASNFLMKECRKQGVFKPERIRGRGFWEDCNRTVINTGSELIVNGKSKDFSDLNTQYFYERSNKTKHIDLNKPLTTGEIDLITKATTAFSWEEKISSELLKGLIVTGPICGFIDWRSHGWITGSQGVGKSTLMNKIIGGLWGNHCLKVQGETSEAGIRQALEFDASPILFDEAEPNEESNKKQIQKIIALARQASSEGEFKVLKGTADHKGKSFGIKSTFIFSSINTALKYKADETRIIVLAIKSNIDAITRKKNYLVLEECMSKFDLDFSERFAGFLAQNLNNLKSNSLKIVKELKERKFSARFADQYGFVLGPASILNHPYKEMTDSEINEYIDQVEEELRIQRDNLEGTQELELLNSILDHLVTSDISGIKKQLSIRKIIKILKEKSPIFESYDDLMDQLKTYGIKLSDDKQSILIANKSKHIEQFTGHTQWGRSLARIPGAKTTNPTSFGGRSFQYKATSIPVDFVTEVP